MSKIEQIITEIEEYIDNCKFQPLSTSKIIVNKDEIDELLAELRLRTPDEIKKYPDDILANVQSILSTGMDSFESAQNTMMTSLNSSLNVVVESRKELGGAEDEESVENGEDDNLSVDLL